MFIDDERYPPDDGKRWVICRNKLDVDWYVQMHGIPKFISFDHDLGEDQPTGYDIAKMLVEYDLGTDEQDKAWHGTLREGFQYYVHSQNPIGKANIEGLLNGYINYTGVIMSKMQLMEDKADEVTTDIYELYEQLLFKHQETLLVAQAALEYIDAIPKDVEFTKAMPGFDRDWADSVVAEK